MPIIKKSPLLLRNSLPDLLQRLEEFARHIGLDLENEPELVWIAENAVKEPLPR